MATTKYANIRYQALDKCFANTGRRYFIDDLVDACNQAIFKYNGNAEGVKKRQVQDDIKYMESESGYAIDLVRERDNRRVYYRYEDPNFSINKRPLNANEEAQLREALLTLGRFKGMPQFEWMDELTIKLEAELGLNAADRKVIEFDQNPYLEGLEHISTLYHAIVNKQTLKIIYQSFQADEPKEISFTPHYLKQYNNRWFAFGWADNFDPITTLALDRIKSISDYDLAYLETDINYEEHFEDVIGVTIPYKAELETILIKVESSLFPYIKSKPLHGSQKVKESHQEYSIIELQLYPNYELETLLLSHGEKLSVLEPKSLTERIKSRLKNACKNY